MSGNTVPLNLFPKECAPTCNIHDTGNGNPHCHIMLTMRPLDERGTWAAKSKKEYVLDENGERIRLPSGRYKTRKVDLMDWNRQGERRLMAQGVG